MQRTPFVLQGNASLARAYRLFRTMGLHHLYVGPPKPRVIGLLTRKVCDMPLSSPHALGTQTVITIGPPETSCAVQYGWRRSHHGANMALQSRACAQEQLHMVSWCPRLKQIARKPIAAKPLMYFAGFKSHYLFATDLI